jgi:H+-translocating NAD(P) transhydrogenase subunit alpha
MKVGVLKESSPGECRVALDAAATQRIVRAGFEVWIESGAGERAGSTDAAYRDAGATVQTARSAVFDCEILLQVRGLGANVEHAEQDLASYRSGQVIVGMYESLYRPEWTARAAERGVTCYSLELIPRTTRAQSMDVLSSMSTIAGYRGVLLAAIELPKIFPLLMTAAGTVFPAKVLVLGAGVAGLQAIATAKRLGASVRGYDIREAAREQIESVGGKFVELSLPSANAEGEGGYAKALGADFYRQQTEALAEHIAASDAVISTAAIPGRQSPLLVTRSAVERMRPGSVVVDLAADRGGNCELSQPSQRVVHQGVVILAPVHLASQTPQHASQMFAANVVNFLLAGSKQGRFDPDPQDEIFQETCAVSSGKIVHPQVQAAIEAQGPSS